MEDYEQRTKEANRLRAKKFYDANKEAILAKRKERRVEINTILKQAKETPPTPALETPSKYLTIIKKKVKQVEEELKSNSTLIPVSVPAPAQPPTLKKKDPITLEYSLKLIATMTYTGDTTKELAPATKSKYSRNIKQYFRLLQTDNLRPDLENPSMIKEKISNLNLGLESKRDILVSILKLLNNKVIANYPKAKYDEIDKIYNELKAESDKSRKAKTTDENYAVDKVETLKKLIEDKYGKNSKENVVLQLYINNPKRDDFGRLKIVNSVAEAEEYNGNSIVIPTNTSTNLKLLIKVHKTSGRYDNEVETINQNLSRIIRAYIKDNKIQEYLFNENKLGPFIKKTFGGVDKPYINGVNYLRHLIVANTLENKDITVEESEQLAKQMKHSVKIQSGYNRAVKK